MLKLNTILHPTDFSPRSGHAFDMACSLARDHGARLICLHVIPREVIVAGGVMTAPPPPPPIDERKRAQEQLRKIRPNDDKIQAEQRLEEGDPVTSILQAAEECKCDLIVMGTHGRTGLDRVLMGSVAEQVLRKAQCPVLTVKGGKVIT